MPLPGHWQQLPVLCTVPALAASPSAPTTRPRDARLPCTGSGPGPRLSSSDLARPGSCLPSLLATGIPGPPPGPRITMMTRRRPVTTQAGRGNRKWLPAEAAAVLHLSGPLVMIKNLHGMHDSEKSFWSACANKVDGCCCSGHCFLGAFV